MFFFYDFLKKKKFVIGFFDRLFYLFCIVFSFDVWLYMINVLMILFNFFVKIWFNFWIVNLIWWLVMWFCGKLYVWICFEWFLVLIVDFWLVLYLFCVFCWILLYIWVCKIFIVFLWFLIWECLFCIVMMIFVGKWVKCIVDVVLLMCCLLVFEVW